MDLFQSKCKSNLDSCFMNNMFILLSQIVC
jgi:hypothetical protein